MLKPDGCMPLGHSNSVVCIRHPDSKSNTFFTSGLQGLSELGDETENSQKLRVLSCMCRGVVVLVDSLGQSNEVGLVVDVVYIGNPHAN